MQYFGGPTTYSDRRGHPRLRLRHVPFAIGPAERDAWLGHMLAAIDAVGIAEPVRSHMRAYFEGTATFMINRVASDQ
jgi:hemoglobin